MKKTVIFQLEIVWIKVKKLIRSESFFKSFIIVLINKIKKNKSILQFLTSKKTYETLF